MKETTAEDFLNKKSYFDWDEARREIRLEDALEAIEILRREHKKEIEGILQEFDKYEYKAACGSNGQIKILTYLHKLIDGK